MATNQAAARLLQDAMIKLMQAYPTAPSSDKARIKFAVNRLKEEYDAIQHRKGASTYSEITKGISAAAGRLRSIADERKKLANSMITAASLLDVVTKVLGLVGR